MREGDIRSTAFQTKTKTTVEKVSDDSGVEEVLQPFQTEAIGFGGRKGENHKDEIGSRLLEVLHRWERGRERQELRRGLLEALILLEDAT